jgi:flavin-dependent dehydrogenase
MVRKYDILVVGAATTGIYFGWLMAKKGHSVLIIDKEAKAQVGQRLEVIHFDQETFKELNVPPPKESPELIRPWKGIWVSRLPLWLQRMYKILESDGVHFEFSCKFKELLYENKRIIGAKLEKKNELTEVKTRLVVDASGAACAVRSSLPEDYGIETWKYKSDNRFFVILHYFKWLKPEEPHPTWGDVWPYHFVFIDPGYSREEPIVGIIGPESFKTVEKIWEDFLEQEDFPPFKVTKREFNSFPLTKQPYSIVADGFFCAGDSAAIMNPLQARGIPETWRLCTDASVIIDNLLKGDKYLSQEHLWEINVNHFRTEGAQSAYVHMLTQAVFALKEKEINFLLKKLRHIVDPPGDSDEASDIKLTAGKMFKIIFKVLGALFIGKISLSTVGRFIKKSRHASKIKKHYKKYPDSPKEFENWVERAKELWNLREVVPREYNTISTIYP